MAIEETQEQKDERFIRLAIDAAAVAEENGDVPIGAVIVRQGQIIGKAYN
jgi:tRNA(adenine34) deaminase